MEINWNDLIDEILLLTIKYNKETKTVSTMLKSKTSYLYKVLSKMTPTFIKIWKEMFNIGLEFDMTLKSKNKCKILNCKELELVILKNIEPVEYAYFQYVLNHKLNVLKNGIDLVEFLDIKDSKIIDTNIFFLHDMSKFSVEEWLPYAKHFYDENGNSIPQKNRVEDEIFTKAWKHHATSNIHHHDYHIKDGVLCPMTLMSILDMFADWKTMSNFGKTNILKWYRDNHDKLKFHILTRDRIEMLLLKCEKYFKDKTFLKCNFK